VVEVGASHPRRPPAPRVGSREHVADAEVHWPSSPPGPHAGQVWAIEVELTPKPAGRTARISKLDRQQNAQITALEDIDPDSPAAPAMRSRIRDRFAELPTQRTDAENKLAALTTAKPRAADPAILDELPYCEDILNGLPPALKARLFAVIDLTILWSKTGGQVTVYATISEETPKALPGILDPRQDGYTTPQHSPRSATTCGH
jgi:hypothetical protein